MSLAEALKEQARTPAGRSPCSVKVLLAALPADEATTLREAFASAMTHAAISRALTSEGHRVAGLTIGRHRKGLCSCDAG